MNAVNDDELLNHVVPITYTVKAFLTNKPQFIKVGFVH